MQRLLIASIGDGPELGPNLAERHLDDTAVTRVVCAADRLAEVLTGAVSPWVAVADGASRFAPDGLDKTLVALGEPSVTAAADGLIHHSTFLLFEGELPRVREVYRMHIGRSAKAPSPTAVLGGAMAQPGALLVRREWLASLPADELGALLGGGSAAAINEALVRRLGADARLLVLPWILVERIAVRSSGVIDLGDALHVDIRQQVAVSELWRHAWGEPEHATVDQIRLLHGLTPPVAPRSIARRALGRVRRMLRRR